MVTAPTTPAPSLRLQVKVSSATIVYEKKALRKVLRQAGAEVASEARSLVRKSVGGGRLYRGPGGKRYRTGGKGGAYRASASGQPPVSVTGTLARSIKVRPYRSGEGVAVRDAAFYALFLEKGAQGGGRIKERRGRSKNATGRVLQPRPFLTAALARKQGGLPGRIRQAVLGGLNLRKVSA